MPDLQSELNKLAQALDDHEETIRTATKILQEKPMTNVTSTTTTTTVTPVPTPEIKNGKIVNNVMRNSFEAVRKNPGKTIKELTTMMTALGFKESSTASVFYQLIRTGQAIKGDDGLVYPNKAIKEYRPITLPTARTKGKNASAEAKRKAAAGIAALKSVPKTVSGTVTLPEVTKLNSNYGVTAPLMQRDWTPKQVIDSLTLPQAKALYAELQQYFG